MGINTGEAIERGGDYFGPAVIKAARLMSLVAGGRAVCSTATAELVQVHLDDDIQLLPVGAVHLKGLSRNESVFAVAGQGLFEQGTPLEAARVTLRTAHCALRPAPIAANRLIGRTVELAAMINAAWVELASAQNRDAAVYEIATATGVRPQVGEELFVTVLNALAAREMLLVLDNCEHLRADVASLVQQISTRRAVATILAISRQRLGGPTERVIPVGPLGVVDANAALALLVERLGASISITERPGLESIVRQVDGIPLAIELGAARCSSLGITEVAAR